MNRVIAALLAASLATAALAEDPATPQEAPAAGADVAEVQGKVEVVAEQVAELKTAVDALRKLKFSGYLQARWAWQESTSNFYNNDPTTAPAQQNFFIRRGRFKAVYDASLAQYVLQIDVLPAGVSIKEGYASIKLPAGLAIDAGLQLFPFGYEVLVRSSSDLDLLERSAATRAYLGGEYDLGVALKGSRGPFNFKIGLFNGNGIDARQNGLDNDQLKDVIGRVGFDFGIVTGGVSGWKGKTIDYTSATDRTYDRERLGADLQLFLDLLPVGGTAVKGEYLWGKTSISNAAGGAGGLLGKTGHGWYSLVTQNLGSWNQVAVRYEEFTPNNTAAITSATSTTVKTQAEIQAALHTFVGGNLKLSVAWFHPLNGAKGDAAPSDPKKDQWIVQAQAKF